MADDGDWAVGGDVVDSDGPVDQVSRELSGVGLVRFGGDINPDIAPRARADLGDDEAVRNLGIATASSRIGTNDLAGIGGEEVGLVGVERAFVYLDVIKATVEAKDAIGSSNLQAVRVVIGKGDDAGLADRDAIHIKSD